LGTLLLVKLCPPAPPPARARAGTVRGGTRSVRLGESEGQRARIPRASHANVGTRSKRKPARPPRVLEKRKHRARRRFLFRSAVVAASRTRAEISTLTRGTRARARVAPSSGPAALPPPRPPRAPPGPADKSGPPRSSLLMRCVPPLAYITASERFHGAGRERE